MVLELAIPVFLAGVIMFLAPCTLPLVPAYLGFISGVSAKEFFQAAPTASLRWAVLRNGFMYVVGFSAVFVLFGMLAGLGGRGLIHWRAPLSQLGGLFIIFFGLLLLRWLPARVLELFEQTKRPLLGGWLTPGHPSSSFLFGAVFALGWTPCVGPVLASVLLLAATTATVAEGAILLIIFSAGMAVPFLLVAATYGWSLALLRRLSWLFAWTQRLAGALLLVLGVLLLTHQFERTVGWFFVVFQPFGYDQLLQFM